MNNNKILYLRSQVDQKNTIGNFEEKRSAKTLGRPIFNEMLARIEKREASGILAMAGNSSGSLMME